MKGAEFVFGEALEGEHVINSTRVNDMDHIQLLELLESIKKGNSSKRIKVAVIRCPAECKVYLLLYELCTRLDS